MKLLLLKILLQRRDRDEGFTLPMVIALGLVMILLGAVSITIANEENITAISQNSRSDALAIAEVGVARYRELLDRNRVLTVYDSAQWGTKTDVCNGDLANFLPGVSNNIALAEDGQILNNDGDSTDSFNIGSYSLVSYDYKNSNSTPVANGVFNLTDDTANQDAIGILKVKGTAPNNAGEAQIQVDIPIRINLDDMTNLAPALWIGNSGITSLGNLTIDNGNVVIRDQASADGCSGFSTLASTTPRRPVISDSRDLPPITKIIADVASARTALSTASGSSINTPDSSPGQVLFGATTHKPYNPDANTSNCPNIKLCRYYYDPPETTGLTYTDTDLLTDGIARTTLLLNQPLTINATTKDIKVRSTSTISNSDAFEIYVKDDDTVTTNFSTNTITINADSGRTVTINSFIHAPQSRLTITGSGTVNINGSVWVKDFINSSATVNISPDIITREPTLSDSSTSGRAYKFYSTTASRTPKPITGSPTNWKTEEVD
jgi:Tfp pilus assembly protein PilX